MSLPAEILDQIVDYVEAPQHGDDRFTARKRQIYDEQSKWRLSTLRLVNKAFCRSASIRFFHHIRVTLSSRHSRFASCHWPPKRLFDLSRSDWCYEVRELDIDLSRSAGHPDLEFFFDDMVAILLACLTGFRRLNMLALRGPLVDANQLSENCQLSLRCLATDLLRYIPFLDLRSLTLSLPLTYDYAAITRRALTSDDTPLRIPLHVNMANIRHLDLTIYDCTSTDELSGRSSSRYPVRDVKRGELNQRPPNHAYALQFFQLAQLPTQLESLKLSCSHKQLDMDNLEINDLAQLQHLDLRCMKISSSRLTSLLTACLPSLLGLILENVHLKSGTWSSIFQVLSPSTTLTVFHLTDACGYTSDGRSSQWVPRRGQPRLNYDKQGRILDVKGLLTAYWHDEPALGVLQRRVLANRAEKGLQTIGEEVYRYAAR